MGRFQAQQCRNLKSVKMRVSSFVFSRIETGISKTASRQTKLLCDSKPMRPTEHGMGNGTQLLGVYLNLITLQGCDLRQTHGTSDGTERARA